MKGKKNMGWKDTREKGSQAEALLGHVYIFRAPFFMVLRRRKEKEKENQQGKKEKRGEGEERKAPLR